MLKSKKVLDVFEKLADIDFQKEVWIQDKYWHEIESFVDATNILFEYDFFNDITQNNIGLLDDELKKVNVFISKLSEYDWQEDESLLSDVNWIQITKDAKTIIEILKKYQW